MAIFARKEFATSHHGRHESVGALLYAKRFLRQFSVLLYHQNVKIQARAPCYIRMRLE